MEVDSRVEKDACVENDFQELKSGSCFPQICTGFSFDQKMFSVHLIFFCYQTGENEENVFHEAIFSQTDSVKQIM